MSKLLNTKEKELRELSKNLFYFDYLDADEIQKIIEGKQVEKQKVREWSEKEPYLIRF